VLLLKIRRKAKIIGDNYKEKITIKNMLYGAYDKNEVLSSGEYYK